MPGKKPKKYQSYDDSEIDYRPDDQNNYWGEPQGYPTQPMHQSQQQQYWEPPRDYGQGGPPQGYRQSGPPQGYGQDVWGPPPEEKKKKKKKKEQNYYPDDNGWAKPEKKSKKKKEKETYPNYQDEPEVEYAKPRKKKQQKQAYDDYQDPDDADWWKPSSKKYNDKKYDAGPENGAYPKQQFNQGYTDDYPPVTQQPQNKMFSKGSEERDFYVHSQPPPNYHSQPQQPPYYNQAPPPQDMGRQPPPPQQVNMTNIMINQPSQGIGGMGVMRAQNENPWSTGLFGCFEDMESCCLSCFCPIWLEYQINSRMGECACNACCMPCLALLLRLKLRTMYGIYGGFWEDTCKLIWCYPCALSQIHREMKNNNTALYN